MATDAAVAHTSEPPQEAWARWEREHADVLGRATKQQQVLLQAAVWFVAVIAGQPLLLRMAAFFLLHAGMGLTPAQVGAAVGAPIGPCARCAGSRPVISSPRSGRSSVGIGSRIK